MRERTRPSWIAYHESGHAVVCWALGVKIAYATIIPAPGAAGLVKHAPTGRPDLVAVIAFGGPRAQRRSHPRSNVTYGALFDREVIAMAAEQLHSAEPDRVEFMRQADRQARELVERHWLAVDHVARGLMVHGGLSGSAIEEIVALAEAEWAAASPGRPSLAPFDYAREQAIMAQGPPPLRRQHFQAAALRLALAGEPFTQATAVADLTARGFDEAAVRRLWSTL